MQENCSVDSYKSHDWTMHEMPSDIQNEKFDSRSRHIYIYIL
jgi:hypothetical protein